MNRGLGVRRAAGALTVVLALGCGSISMVDDTDGGGGQGGGTAGSSGGRATGTAGTAAGGTGGAVAGRGGATGTAGVSGTTGSAGTTGYPDGGLYLIDADVQKDTGVDTGRIDAGQCTPGDRRCDPAAPNTPMTCDDNGAWQRGTACPSVCSMGVCGGICTPGARSCVGNIPQSCDSQGQWQSAPACSYVCRQGNCSGVCAPGARQCSTTGVPQQCNADGAWEGSTPCPFVCSQGQCTGVCKPATTGCNNNVPQTCTSAGEWQSGSPCPFVCSAGTCAGSCTPGARQCANNIPQTCNANGMWTSGSACQFVCTPATGMCGGSCAPGSTRCQNGQKQMCDASGAWQNTPSPTTQMLINPGFDSGHVNWVEDTDSTSQIITNQSSLTTIQAQSPPYLGWLGGYDKATDDLFQTLTIPTGATSITLSFYYAIRTEETGAGVYDSMDVYTFEPATSAYVPIATFTDDSPVTTWTRFTATLPNSLAGKTIEIGFLATTDAVDTTSFFVDSVTLDVAACAP